MFISYLNMNNISRSEIKWKFQDNDNIGYFDFTLF